MNILCYTYLLLNNEGDLKRKTFCVGVNGNSIVKAQLH